VKRTSDVLILIPAFNEAGAIARVVHEVRSTVPHLDALVVDDSSADGTVSTARGAGADVLELPIHLGLGGCVQAGYKLAYELGYEYVIRVDGDGQHDPAYIPEILRVLQESGVQMVIGSRYVNGNKQYTSSARGVGIALFRWLLRPILGRAVEDPTSGYVGVNRQALEVFSRSFPLEYPEIEALVVLRRKAFRFAEIPCRARPRTSGRSSITPIRSLYYIVHVLLGVFVNILKYEGPRRRR
jgi:glycosyltransferase involved in cell wall biosynthesis